MAINKGTLAKEVNGVIEYIYPKTTSEIVEYTPTQSVKDKLDSLDSSASSLSTNINNKLDKTLKGASNGLAELDSNGKVPSSQLPSYVDDVIEGYLINSKFYSDSSGNTKLADETSKIYIDLNTNKTYRWSGSSYVVISDTIALGETSSTAYRGDNGKVAYEHSQTVSGNPHNVTKSDIGLSNVENKSSATIRGELTKTDVTNALGYTPPTTDTQCKWGTF